MTKKSELECFDIIPDGNHLTTEPNFCKEILDVLEKSTAASDRIRPLSDLEEDGELQLISNFKNTEAGVFCSFLHLKAGNALNISQKLLDQKIFSESDVTAEENDAIKGHIKNHAYFLMTKDRLVLLKRGGSKKSDIQTYLNYLLIKNREEYASKVNLFTIASHINKNYDVSEIGSFMIGGEYEIKKNSVFSVLSKTFDFKNIFEATGIKDIDPNDILSASITFKIKGKTKNNIDEQNKLVQKIIESFTPDALNVKDRRGNFVDLKNAKTTKEIKLEMASDVFPDRDKLLEQMAYFLKEVR